MRPSIDDYYLSIAKLAAGRGTCIRRKVGCVLTDFNNRVLSIGYNGVPPSMNHCIEMACPGAYSPSGEGLELCEAVHAEQSALIACRNINEIKTCYSTVSPCITCIKLLLNTACQRIVFSEMYAHLTAIKLWERANRVWLLQESDES